AGCMRAPAHRRATTIADAPGAGAEMPRLLYSCPLFLPDIPPFGKIAPAEMIHIGFMRKGVAISEINSAARHAERDAVRLIILRAHKRGAKFARRGGGAMRRNHHTKSERRQARIGIGQALFGRAALGRILAVPDREHA